jgi:hypothetical protein
MNPRYWGIASWLMVSLVFLAALSYKPSSAAYGRWKEAKMLRDAIEALATGANDQARQLSLFLVKTSKESKRAMPILVAAADQLADPSRARYAKAVLNALPPGDRNRILAWRVMCRSGPAWQVMHAWSALSDSEIENPGFVDALLDRMLRERMLDEGRWLISRQPIPLQPSHLLRQLRFLAAADDEPALLDLQVKLIEIAGERPDQLPSLLQVLDLIPPGAILPETARAVLEALPPAAADVEKSDISRRARLEMAADPSSADGIFNETLDRLKREDPIHAARWCLMAGRPQVARDFLNGDQVQHTQEWHELSRLAAERLEDATAWRALLESPVPGAFMPEIHCDLAHVCSLLRDEPARKAAETAALRDAIASAGDEALIRLAERAEFRDMREFASRVWLEAVRRANGPLPHAKRLETLIAGLATAGREDDLMALLAVYRNLEPENVVIRIQHAYLSCVTGRSVPSAVARDLDRLATQLPGIPQLVFTLALSRLLVGDVQGAGHAIASVEPAVIRANPAYVAIRALIHLAGDNPDEAEMWLAAIAWEKLLPSEKKLFRSLLDSYAEDSRNR